MRRTILAIAAAALMLGCSGPPDCPEEPPVEVPEVEDDEVEKEDPPGLRLSL